VFSRHTSPPIGEKYVNGGRRGTAVEEEEGTSRIPAERRIVTKKKSIGDAGGIDKLHRGTGNVQHPVRGKGPPSTTGRS